MVLLQFLVKHVCPHNTDQMANVRGMRSHIKNSFVFFFFFKDLLYIYFLCLYEYSDSSQSVEYFHILAQATQMKITVKKKNFLTKTCSHYLSSLGQHEAMTSPGHQCYLIIIRRYWRALCAAFAWASSIMGPVPWQTAIGAVDNWTKHWFKPRNKLNK